MFDVFFFLPKTSFLNWINWVVRTHPLLLGGIFAFSLSFVSSIRTEMEKKKVATIVFTPHRSRRTTINLERAEERRGTLIIIYRLMRMRYSSLVIVLLTDTCHLAKASSFANFFGRLRRVIMNGPRGRLCYWSPPWWWWGSRFTMVVVVVGVVNSWMVFRSLPREFESHTCIISLIISWKIFQNEFSDNVVFRMSWDVLMEALIVD